MKPMPSELAAATAAEKAEYLDSTHGDQADKYEGLSEQAGVPMMVEWAYYNVDSTDYTSESSANASEAAGDSASGDTGSVGGEYSSGSGCGFQKF